MTEKKKRIRWNIDKVRNYIEVESGSGCSLITEVYKNTKTSLKIKCKCNEEFSRSFDHFLNEKIYHCERCLGRIKWNFLKVKNYMEVECTSRCTLISLSYTSYRENLEFKCSCGNDFSATWYAFYNQGKRHCDECGMKSRIEKLKKTNENFLTEAHSVSNCEYIFLDEYQDNLTELRVIHRPCGHEYAISPRRFLNGSRCEECIKTDFLKEKENRCCHICTVKGERKYRSINGEFYCLFHYKQIKSSGESIYSYKDINEVKINISEENVEIYLRNRKNEVTAITFIDIEDYEEVKLNNWGITGNGYVRSRRRKTKEDEILLHRLILDAKECEVVDHVDGNPLNNRKSNLRIVTSSQNSMNSKTSSDNTSGTKGVSFDKRKETWESYISKEGKKIYLGNFVNIDDAIRARKEAELKYHGEYSRDSESGGNVYVN